MDPQLRRLITERGVVKTTLTKLKTFVSGNLKSMPITNIQTRLEFHRPLVEKFVKLQNQIEIAITGTDIEIFQSDERDHFTDLCFSLISEIKDTLRS